MPSPVDFESASIRIVLQISAVQRCHLIPRIPGESIRAIRLHVAVQVVADRRAVPVGQLVGHVSSHQGLNSSTTQ